MFNLFCNAPSPHISNNRHIQHLKTNFPCVALAIPVDCINNLQSDITIVVNPIPPEVCQFIITDKHWLIENILCLLSNATKYSTCESYLTELLSFVLYLVKSLVPFPSPSSLSHYPFIPSSIETLFLQAVQ
jgi:hypothetical protein